MTKGISVLLVLMMVSLASAGEEKIPVVPGLPAEAFRLLAKSSLDPCTICAEEMREKAFQVLDGEFKPGKVLRSNNDFQFMRTDTGGENRLALTSYPPPPGERHGKDPSGEQRYLTLPLLTFRFHTAEKHLVGISVNDYTEERLAGEYRSAPVGAIFEGTLKIVEYGYGDGPAYVYYPGRNHVEVHCMILDLKRINEEQEQSLP